jgi:hypothetical protein
LLTQLSTFRSTFKLSASADEEVWPRLSHFEEKILSHESSLENHLAASSAADISKLKIAAATMQSNLEQRIQSNVTNLRSSLTGMKQENSDLTSELAKVADVASCLARPTEIRDFSSAETEK